MKTRLLLLSALTLAGCSSSEVDDCTDCTGAPTTVLIPNKDNTAKPDPDIELELEVEEVIIPDSDVVADVENNNDSLGASSAVDSEAVSSLYAFLAERVKDKWGPDGYIESGKHRYVKYLDDYTTRADIHFDTGKIYISTISQNAPLEKLHSAIVQTLLMPSDPDRIDLFGTRAIQPSNDPFFLGQILDQDGEPIKWEWRATRFATYLLENSLQKEKMAKGNAHFVEIDLVGDHMDVREYKYSDQVQTAARKYGIPEDLIYAVIKTESSFNPYAVSHSGAFGLMQIIPSTAGADVFKLVHNKPGIPSKEYLMEPDNNIDTGTAYLYLLRDRYLRELTDLTSRHFGMISAYNSGTGGVLETFSKDRVKAVEIINSKTPRQVYDILVTEHPKEEARRYLQKVLYFQKDFNLNEI